MTRNAIRKVCLLIFTLAGFALLIGAANGAKHRGVTYSTGEFSVDCDLSDRTPQICDPARKLEVRVGRRDVRIKRVRYVASAKHCSAGRVLVSLDGSPIGRTDFVDAGEKATVDGLKVTLDRGRHTFAFRIEGRAGGCNVGYVGSWGGKVTLKGSKKRR
ncbi:MAG: hypothetical protein R2718_03280 [Solirubrobacterales bacterium]|nr:hypothetical protein [Solirubrobacterales bacterium]